MYDFFYLQVEDDLHSFCYQMRKKKHIFKQVACGRHDMDFFKTLSFVYLLVFIFVPGLNV